MGAQNVLAEKEKNGFQKACLCVRRETKEIGKHKNQSVAGQWLTFKSLEKPR